MVPTLHIALHQGSALGRESAAGCLGKSLEVEERTAQARPAAHTARCLTFCRAWPICQPFQPARYSSSHFPPSPSTTACRTLARPVLSEQAVVGCRLGPLLPSAWGPGCSISNAPASLHCRHCRAAAPALQERAEQGAAARPQAAAELPAEAALNVGRGKSSCVQQQLRVHSPRQLLDYITESQNNGIL